MSWFRNRNKEEIPPAPSSRSSGTPAPSYRSNASTYNYSRDGPDPYSTPPSTNYQRNDPYDRQPPSQSRYNDYGDDYGRSDNRHYDDRSRQDDRDGPRRLEKPRPDDYRRDDRPRYDEGSRQDSGQSYDQGDRYGRNKPIGDTYSRTGGNAEADRNELFAGYNPQQSNGRNRFDDRYNRGGGEGGRSAWQDRTPQTQEEEDEDIETIKKDTRALKNDTVQSSRNALRIAREAEETARNTLQRLGDQSEQLANVERHLDTSKANTSRAEDKTDELKKLNRSIFRPAIVWDKEGKRQKQEAKMNARWQTEREDRERTMADSRESQNRVGRAATYGTRGEEDTYGANGSSAGGYGRRGNLTQQEYDERKASNKRYQFESTASDEELDEEVDDNVDEIHDITKRLKALATAQGQEVDSQNKRLDRMNNNAGDLDMKITRATDRLKRVK